MRIMHLHWGFPPIIGGVETHLACMLPVMTKRKNKLSLITGSVEGVRPECKYKGVSIYRTPLMDLNWLFKRGLVGLENEVEAYFKKIIERASRTLDPITPREIKAYYNLHRDEFAEPAAVRFRQVVTKNKDDAVLISKRLKEGEDLGELAVNHSISPEGERGGEVGWIAKGVLDESMEKVLLSLPVGKTGPVVESPYGYHIFEVTARRPEGFKSLPDAVAEIEAKLLEEKKEAFYGRWLKELRGLFTVRVNQELLEDLELG